EGDGSVSGFIRLGFPFFAALGVMFSVSALVLALFNYFAGPIGSELGLSDPEVSFAMSIYLATLIFAMPVAGIIVDRVGSRWTIIVSGLLFSVCLLWIS